MAAKKKAVRTRRTSGEIELDRRNKELQAKIAELESRGSLDSYLESSQNASDKNLYEVDAPAAQSVPKPGKQREFTVVLQSRHADWLIRMAHYEGLRRRESISPERFVEILVREAFAADPTKGGTLSPGSSGKAGAFNPAGGDWSE